MFKVINCNSNMIGGHYAVEDNLGRNIGERWRLNREHAVELCRELERAQLRQDV